MLKSKTILLALTLMISIVTADQLNAQVGASSPYSKYGIGNLYHITNVQSNSMGGLSQGIRNSTYVNYKNPASYTAFDSTSFLFEGGLAGQYVTLSTSTDEENSSAFSVSHLLFGFPVTRWWRSSFGMMPYSNVDYQISDVDSSDIFGTIDYLFSGNGGVNRVYIGNAFKVTDFLSVGVNFNYLFGTYNYSQTQTFVDSTNLLNLNLDNSVTISDYFFDYGIQLHKTFENKLDVVLGGVFNNSQKLSSRRKYLARNFFFSNNNVINYIDTISHNSFVDKSLTMPMSYGFGIALSKNKKWLVGADYEWKKWSSLQTIDQPVLLNDAFEVSVGAEYSPANYSSVSYWEKIDYRMGARYSNTYLNLRDTQIDDFGITFGLGLPIKSIALRGAKARFNVGAEIGSRGSLQKDLIQENYFNAYFSVSIYEWWFIKRKFD